ncbi:unnamed protein product [Closterium sp. NIES-64]|nr:unnamed protein product [Closterium sp. NIES-64]
MLGNACEACGLEHVDDNTLQSHVSKNVKCRRKIQHSRAQRLVEAYRDALRARRGARPRSPVRSLRSYEGDSTERAAVEPGAVADQPDPPEGLEEDSDGGESVMSVIDDVFNTLVELYIFFREADLSRRECYLERWNFAETTWGNVFHACAADLLHVLDGGMLPRMGKCFMIGRSKPERREFERRRKEQKKDTRACVVRIPGGTTWMVAAIKASFPDQTSDWNIPKVHQIVHLIDGIPLHGMPNETSTNLWEHTHKGTVKVPVRGSNWHDIPRRIVEEEVQREIAREVAAEAGGK